MECTEWVTRLDLKPHPEGGWYREVYRSSDVVPAPALPPGFPGARSLCTSIYYLLGPTDASAFHRIRSDEIWHLYAGGPLELHLIDGSRYEVVVLGVDLMQGEAPQVVVPKGVWFAATPRPDSPGVLVGCTVSPGFDFEDFEFGTAEKVFGERPDLRAPLGHLIRSRA